MRAGAIFLSAVIMFFSCARCYGGESGAQEQQTRKISGTVSQVSFVHSFIRVICEDGYVKFRVPEGIKILRGAKPVGLEDIDTEDSVIVQFTVGENGERTAVAIRDNTVKRAY